MNWDERQLELVVTTLRADLQRLARAVLVIQRGTRVSTTTQELADAYRTLRELAEPAPESEHW